VQRGAWITRGAGSTLIAVSATHGPRFPLPASPVYRRAPQRRARQGLTPSCSTESAPAFGHQVRLCGGCHRAEGRGGYHRSTVATHPLRRNSAESVARQAPRHHFRIGAAWMHLPSRMMIPATKCGRDDTDQQRFHAGSTFGCNCLSGLRIGPAVHIQSTHGSLRVAIGRGPSGLPSARRHHAPCRPPCLRWVVHRTAPAAIGRLSDSYYRFVLPSDRG